MGALAEKLFAPTLDELEKMVNEWYRNAAAQGLADVRLPWDPEAVQETKDGFVFEVRAHT